MVKIKIENGYYLFKLEDIIEYVKEENIEK